ncbi:putative transcriptional regulator [Paenibacillus cellulosilyticus]|uniref:Putative transcriptional regulator n=1 Tax=Paenibacillus cellulosilyticus TaxID=375489 RepID=A0A2V2YR62_9BACL|nr:ASCH domain-containing protein [Paenibacillus cellulosilyticus]PWV97378.1 putative transcriptional regulator [Paenibacillus cellulosilyticus]QKS48578.1 ASCH domain-containing protein [Paenibacillus cellulosilyticus]
MNVLLSIKPEFVEKIFTKEKRYEYRKSIFKQKVDKVIIYSTMPEGMIVGEFQIEDILCGEPEKIWEATNDFSGISYGFYNEYFKSKDEAYAIKIGYLTRYKEPIDPKTLSDSFTAPQSFFYIDDNYQKKRNKE